jgi:shikimate dehydrogenase
MNNISKEARVIGNPIAHSLSPVIFGYIASEENYELNYDTQILVPEELKSYLLRMSSIPTSLGLNVTLPFKEEVISLSDSVSPEVKALGAANVLHFKESKIFAFNTDIIGIMKTFEGKSFSLEGRTVLMWGAGGSARAMAYVFGKEKVKQVYIFNRSERGEELAKFFGKLFPDTYFKAISDLAEAKLQPLDAMVNTTPLGMSGKEKGETYFSMAKDLSFSKGALAFDLIYDPEETDFLKVSKHLGLDTVGGLGMLIDQALATWELWIGPLKNKNQLHHNLSKVLRGVLRLRNEKSPLYFVGFMGVGKSTVAQHLAKVLKRELIDTDQKIVETAKMPITEIFNVQGEKAFRHLEKEEVLRASKTRDSVVSLGGGAMIQEENAREILSSGTVIYLEANEESLLERISQEASERPLLKNLSLEEKKLKVKTMLETRRPLYERAHVKIATEKLNSLQVSFQVLKTLGSNP